MPDAIASRHAPDGSALLGRRAALLLPVFGAAVLAACADDTPAPPPDFSPLRFDYLIKLRLTVASIDVDNAFVPAPVPNGVHVEALAPMPPADALRRMALDRLIPAGAEGHAVFVIQDASLVQVPGQFIGAMKVQLEITGAPGGAAGSAEAHVSRTRTYDDDSADATRAALYDMVKDMMADMNVEFEYQVRRTLRPFLQDSAPVAPPPAAVEQQDLPPAGKPTP